MDEYSAAATSSLPQEVDCAVQVPPGSPLWCTARGLGFGVWGLAVRVQSVWADASERI